MNRLKRFLLSKRFIAGILAVFQICLFFVLSTRLYATGTIVYLIMTIFSIMVMLYLLEKDNVNSSYKILWILIMAIFPISGAVFYFLWGDTKMTRKQEKKMYAVIERTRRQKGPRPAAKEELASLDTGIERQIRYLEKMAFAPAYANTSVRYYPMGAALFKDYLADLENARESIFLQYYIIDEGYLWDRVLEILKKKARQGLDVRVIYDGFGTLFTLPENYEKTLRRAGIKTYIFNDVKFSAHIGDYLMLNHRDHRKLTVIDSTIAYSGGVNIADEYINAKERFGVWKDTGFRLEGEGVWGLTQTFLQTWELVSLIKSDYQNYLPRYGMNTDGYVQPYFDTPLDKERVCQNNYLNVINNSKEYVWIATPYLVLDEQMVTALTIAAKSGVDVRIVVPGIPDKWYVYYVTQSYYKRLLSAGVKLYEYIPGFIHAKMYVSDDIQAIVGGANTDYRSMYLNYENCCGFYGGNVVGRVKADFEQTFTHCRQVNMADVENTSFFKRLCQIIFRVLGPLM